MKKILLVEDFEDKANIIKSFLKDNYPNVIVNESTSYKSACKEIYGGADYDMILLDMTMSTYDISDEDNGGEPEPRAGRLILKGMYLRDIPTKVVVVTMYNSFDGQKLNSLHNELSSNYADNYLGYVSFQFQSNEWEEELKAFIDNNL